MKYIIMVTEYLTKQVETKAIKIDDVKAMTIFLCANVITQFSCPKKLM